jgi:hypothetical protein
MVVATLVGLPVLLLLLVAMPTSRTSVSLSWGNFVSRGAKFYLIERTTHFESRGLPIPERPPERVISSSWRMIEFDLEGGGHSRNLGDAIQNGPQGPDFEYVFLDSKGNPTTQSSAEVEATLKKALPQSCEGKMRDNPQDWRVMYYLCIDQDVVYRFDYPFDKAIPILLGDAGGMPGEINYDLFSVAGDPRTFARSYTDKVYEIDLTARENEGTRAVRLDLSPEAAESLLGISSTVRIFQVRNDEKSLVIRVERAGQEPKNLEYKTPVVNGSMRNGRYVAASERVLWFYISAADIEPILSLDLRTDEFQLSRLVRH